MARNFGLVFDVSKAADLRSEEVSSRNLCLSRLAFTQRAVASSASAAERSCSVNAMVSSSASREMAEASSVAKTYWLVFRLFSTWIACPGSSMLQSRSASQSPVFTHSRARRVRQKFEIQVDDDFKAARQNLFNGQRNALPASGCTSCRLMMRRIVVASSQAK